jgi:hypothetical protein
MESQLPTQSKTEEKTQKKRKKYEKPAVVYLAPLEAMAAGCDPYWLLDPNNCISNLGKNNSTQCKLVQNS